jgi:hypothetical protein
MSNAQNSMKKNSLALESNFIMTLSASYDRIIPLKEKTVLMIGADYSMGIGFGYGSHWIIPEANLQFFGPKHFLETGVQYAFGLDENDEEANSSPGIKIAYRLQGKKGFYFRATAGFLFLIDPVFIPAVGIGYSF